MAGNRPPQNGNLPVAGNASLLDRDFVWRTPSSCFLNHLGVYTTYQQKQPQPQKELQKAQPQHQQEQLSSPQRRSKKRRTEFVRRAKDMDQDAVSVLVRTGPTGAGILPTINARIPKSWRLVLNEWETNDFERWTRVAAAGFTRRPS